MCPGHSNQTHLWVGRFRGHARGGEGSPSHAEWRHFPTINALAVAIEFGDGWMDWDIHRHLYCCQVLRAMYISTQVATSAYYEKQGIFLPSLPPCHKRDCLTKLCSAMHGGVTLNCDALQCLVALSSKADSVGAFTNHWTVGVPTRRYDVVAGAVLSGTYYTDSVSTGTVHHI
jgi:hypothetical protein